ncbi:MAG: hypothetical protein HG467_003970 [Clostridiales bacterium]|nr:hypothetical protein [Clostridiales bacterium]
MDELFESSQKPKAKKRKINRKNSIILTTIFIITLIITIAVVYGLNGNKRLSAKEIVIQNLKTSSIEEYTDLSDFEKLIDKVNTSVYESNINLNIDADLKNDTNSTNGSSASASKILKNVKLKDINFAIKTKENNKENKGQVGIQIKYKDNLIFDFDFLDDGKEFAIFEPSYFQEYIGVEKTSLKTLENWLPKGELDLDAETKRNNVIQNLDYNVNQNKKLNIAKEAKQIMTLMQKNLIKEVETISNDKFKIKRNVPTKYREKDVKADNVTIDLSGEEYNKLITNVINNTKKEITENISNYPTFKTLETIDGTLLGNILNSYVFPLQNLGINKINTQSLAEDKKEGTKKEENVVSNIPVVQNKQNSPISENQVNTSEKPKEKLPNSQETQNPSNSTNSSLDYSKTNKENSNNINLNGDDNKQILAVSNNQNVQINLYVIAGKDIKIDTVVDNQVISTVELYKEEKTDKREIIYGEKNNQKDIKVKISRVKDDNTVYNNLELKEVKQGLEEGKNEKIITAELKRNSNIDTSSNIISYKMNKNEYGVKTSTIFENSIKFSDGINVGTDKKIELLNTLGADNLKTLMETVVFPQVKKVTTEKIYMMENLASIGNTPSNNDAQNQNQQNQNNQNTNQ